MDEDVMDAGSIDELDDYELTGEMDDPVNEPQSEEATETSSEAVSEPENTQVDTNEEDPDDSFTAEVLRLKGIEDPSKIKFEDESGAMIERNWNDLSDTERLNILAANEDPERDLNDAEIELINLLRKSDLTPQQYIQTIQQNAAQEALEQYQSSQKPNYEVDSLSDDELFALDLLERVGEENVTDEELQEALTAAKANETLYAKQIEGLRSSYKHLEDQQKYDAEQAQTAQYEQQYQNFSNQVLDQIGGFNSFANQDISLDVNDKNDIANYMLTRRESGISDFYTDMQDPAKATLAAFWMLKGPEVLNEMENQVRAAYQRGYNVGKSTINSAVTPKTPQVVVQPQTKSTSVDTDFQSAFGLEDDSYLN